MSALTPSWPAAASAFSSMSQMKTRAPAWANPSAMVLPIPEAAAETATLRPLSDSGRKLELPCTTISVSSPRACPPDRAGPAGSASPGEPTRKWIAAQEVSRTRPSRRLDPGPSAPYFLFMQERKVFFLTLRPGAAYGVEVRRPSWPMRIALAAAVLALLAGGVALALLAFWLAMILLPIAILAALIAYAIGRFELWRAERRRGYWL